jgi:hypothetical protein
MPTNLTDQETPILTTAEPDPEAVNAYLRAHGVRPATQPWGGPYDLTKPRPWWLALIIRSLRRLRLYDD